MGSGEWRVESGESCLHATLTSACCLCTCMHGGQMVLERMVDDLRGEMVSVTGEAGGMLTWPPVDMGDQAFTHLATVAQLLNTAPSSTDAYKRDQAMQHQIGVLSRQLTASKQELTTSMRDLVVGHARCRRAVVGCKVPPPVCTTPFLCVCMCVCVDGLPGTAGSHRRAVLQGASTCGQSQHTHRYRQEPVGGTHWRGRDAVVVVGDGAGVGPKCCCAGVVSVGLLSQLSGLTAAPVCVLWVLVVL